MNNSSKGRGTSRRTQEAPPTAEVAIPTTREIAFDMPTLSVQDARERVWTEEDADAFVVKADDVRKGIVELGTSLMWQGALVGPILGRSGLLGDGKRWAGHADYLMTAGFSKGYASKLVTVGIAAVQHGVTYGSDEYANLWSVLKGTEGTKETRKAVLDAVRGEDTDAFRSTLAVHEKAVQALKAKASAAAAVTSAAEVADTPEGEGAESEGGEGAESEGRAPGGAVNVTTPEGERREPRPTVEDCRALLRQVRELLHRMTPASQREVFDDMYLIVADCEGRNDALGPVEEDGGTVQGIVLDETTA